MKVWVPEGPGREHIGALPAAVDVGLIPPDPQTARDLGDVELLVPDHGHPGLIDALRSMDRLRVVQTLTAGVDWIAPHVPDAVTLCNARGAYDVPVAEWVAGVILAAERRLPAWWRAQARERWDRHPPRGEWPPSRTGDLEGQRVLLVGHGSIGRAVERRLEPFGVDIRRVGRRAREGVHAADELPGLLPDADVVVVLVPLTSETRGLVDAAFLDRMRDNALLVNAARGELVDTGALVAAAGTGRIRAALDVTDPEPLPDGHPLWSAPNVLVTPHIAGESDRRSRAVWQLVGDQIRRYAAGEPLINVVEGDY